MEELIAFDNANSYAFWMKDDERKPTDAGYAVDWYDSVGFCRWLSTQRGLEESEQAYVDPESLDAKEYPREPNPVANWAPRDWPLELDRRGFRLPTESEWEIATRANSRTPYGFGGESALLKHFGWFTDNSGNHVHTPKELRPSISGLYDMHGNLLEWTHHWFSEFAESLVADPRVNTRGSSRVYRGGSWSGPAANCRTASRGTSAPPYRGSGTGFRLALSPSVKHEQSKVE